MGSVQSWVTLAGSMWRNTAKRTWSVTASRTLKSTARRTLRSTAGSRQNYLVEGRSSMRAQINRAIHQARPNSLKLSMVRTNKAGRTERREIHSRQKSRSTPTKSRSMVDESPHPRPTKVQQINSGQKAHFFWRSRERFDRPHFFWRCPGCPWS